MWWKLASIISPDVGSSYYSEFTKIFTSSNSTHVQEIVSASREGGPSQYLIGIVAGNFSAFWQGIVMVGLMLVGFFISTSNLSIFDGMRPFLPSD